MGNVSNDSPSHQLSLDRTERPEANLARDAQAFKDSKMGNCSGHCMLYTAITIMAFGLEFHI